MISHFNLPAGESSFYFEISTIQQDSRGFNLTGVVGDGSAEASFEASVGEQLQVCVLPVWDGGSDSLCQRYEQSTIEQGLVACLEDVRFCCERTFNPEAGCWQQKVVALAKPSSPAVWSPPRHDRPYHQVCEAGVSWQRQAAC